MDGAVEHTRLPVRLPGGERCTACVLRLEEGLDAVSGVGTVETDAAASELEVAFDPQTITREQLVAEVERLGYEVGAAISHASWKLSGLDCPDCARTVDVSISHLDGVFSASLNFASGVLFVEYDPRNDPRPSIEDLVARMGYPIESLDEAAGRPVAEFTLGGLDCPDCARGLAESIRALEGVESADVDFSTARLRVGYDASQTDADAVVAAVEAAGYGIVNRGGAAVESAGRPKMRRKGEWATAASGVLIVVGWLAGWWLGERDGLGFAVATAAPYAASIVLGGGLIARRALSSVRARVLDMNVLMTVAVVGAAAIGEWSEAATVVFLFSIGGILEARSLERTRSSIRDLMDLAPQTARVVRGGEQVEVGPGQVEVGERIVVKPGERVPLDGRIVEGSSAFDESAITGESVPADKSVGDEVFAGTLNTHGLIEAEVLAPAEDTTLARVVYLVEEAQAQRAPFQRLVDRFTRWYTPAVTIFAAALAIVPPLIGVVVGDALGIDLAFETWFYRALVLLVVSCPCALVISTPVAIVSAITRASRDGVLVKGGAFLERAPRIRALAFDKTGTLTLGRPEVVEVVAVPDVDRDELVALAAALEHASTHPVAQAVVRAAHPVERAVPEPVALTETPGRGVTAQVDGRTVRVGSVGWLADLGVDPGVMRDEIDRVESLGQTCLAVVLDDGVIGVLGVADTMRPDAPRAVAALRAAGIGRITMVTGDNERVADRIAEAADLDDFTARTLPAEKVDVVRSLKERWGDVAMVGDGVNDAPALAVADLGIAMGAAGSDTALETADVALMSDDLTALAGFFDLGRRTVANIKQNVWFSVAIKLAVLVAAVFGYAPLWLAVLADTGVALLVILNGLRLLRPNRLQNPVGQEV